MANPKITKKDLGQMMSEKFESVSKKEGVEIIEWMFEEFKTQMQSGMDVFIKDFGKFKIFESKARMGINPITKEKISISAKRKVKYYPAKAVKDLAKQ